MGKTENIKVIYRADQGPISRTQWGWPPQGATCRDADRGDNRMNEKERFEEKYIKQFINTPIEKTGLSYEMAKWGWQARAEIAKQDEKKLIEALIETTMKMEEESIAHHWDKICPARSRMINNIIVIEKHTGKTWEELNG